MSRQDQIEILLNQATAAIVVSYLEHMNTAINKGIAGATLASDITNPAGGGATAIAQAKAFISQAELVSLIDAVQSASRNV